MERMNTINVVVTPQKPIVVKTQVKTTQVQIGTDAALGAVTQGVIDLHKKVDDLSNKQVDVDLTPVAKEQTLTDGVNTLAGKIDNIKLPEVDLSAVAQESTLNILLEEIGDVKASFNTVNELLEMI